MGIIIPSISLLPLEILETHEGGFGKVLLVKDENSRKYALKFIKTGNNTEAIEEGLKLIKLPSHPNLIEIIDIVDYENEKVLVLNYCLKSLADVTAKSLKNDEIEKIIFDIASGLYMLHEKCAMLHLDLKPNNILLSEKNNWVISDFGLSRVIDRFRPTDSEKIESFSGTVPYMAPEQLVYGEASRKSDVFSFGIIVFELLTQRHPFIDGSEKSVEDIARHIIGKNVGFSLKEKILIKSWERDLALHCLEKNPLNRPTFTEITQILNNKTSTFKSFSFVEDKNYEMIRKANALIGAEKFDEAQSILEKLYETDPFNLTILINLVQCRFSNKSQERGDGNSIIISSKKLTELSDKLESALELYAWYANDKNSLELLLCNLSSYLLSTSPEKAKTYAEQALKINPNDWQAAGNIAEACLILENIHKDKRAEYLNSALKYSTFAYNKIDNDLTVICTHGKTLLRLKKLKELRPLLQRGIDIFGTDNLSFRLILIRYYIQNREFSEAIETLESMRNHKTIETLVFQCDRELIETQYSERINNSATPEALTHSLLGDFYLNSATSKPDFENAVKHWLIAVKEGVAEAEFQLGISYYHGKGINKDQAKAMQYLYLAAKHGDPDAKAALGIS